MREAGGRVTPVCVYIFTALKSPVSRLITVELQFKLKAINLQTIRHHELPDCYDFTLTVSVGWANLIPVWRKMVYLVMCSIYLC